MRAVHLLVLLTVPGLLSAGSRFPEVSRSLKECHDIAATASCSGNDRVQLLHYWNRIPTQTGGIVTLWVTFNFNATDTVGVQPAANWCHPFTPRTLYTGQLVHLGGTVYNASHNVVLNSSDNYGLYEVYVCGEMLQNFTVHEGLPDCNKQPTSVIHINSSVVVPICQNLFLTCGLRGYWAADIQWSNSMGLLTTSRFKIETKRKLDSNCTFYSRLTIVNATSDDTNTYTCSVIGDNDHVTSSATTNLTIAGLPVFITSPHDQLHGLNEILQLEYKITGAAEYMQLQIKVNNFKLDHYCNSSQCNISVTPLPSAPGVILQLNINERTLKPNNYTFQVCAHIVSSDYIQRCDSNPACSERTLVTIQEGGPSNFILIVASTAGGGGFIVVVFLLAVVGLSIYFWKCRKRRRYDRLDDNQSNEHRGESVIRRRPPTIVGSPLEHTEDLEREQGRPRVHLERKVFIVYEKSTKPDEVQNLCDILNVFSKAPQERVFVCDCDIQHRDEVGIDWSNWTVQQIKEADVVLLVCSLELHSCLSQCRDQVPIQTTTGLVSAAAIANLCNILKDSAKKFIPVFLNQPIDTKLMPTSLAGRKAYQVNTAGLMAIQSDGMEEEEFAQKTSDYLTAHMKDETKDLIELVQCLQRNLG